MEGNPIGLVKNAKDVAFQCGTCRFYSDDTCHHSDPRLNGQHVEDEWCCNHYAHDGMKTIIQ